MFCIHCGREISEGDRFCQHCGGRIEMSGEEEKVDIETVQEEKEQGELEQEVIEPEQMEEIQESLPDTHILGMCSHEDMMRVMKKCYIDIASSEYRTQLKESVKGRVVAVTIDSPDGKYRIWIQGWAHSNGRLVRITERESGKIWAHKYLLLRKFVDGVRQLCNAWEV